MNTEVLGLWIGLIGGAFGALVILAYFLTGQKYAGLRIGGAVLVLVSVAANVLVN